MTATLPAQVREVFDRFIHPSFYGSLVSLNPSTRNELLGVNALVSVIRSSRSARRHARSLPTSNH